MPAQLGSSLLLEYGPQGSRQLGSVILLDTVPPIPPALRIVAGTRSVWGDSATLRHTVRVPHPAGTSAGALTTNPWPPTDRPADTPARASWTVAAASDEAAQAPWERFTSRAEAEKRSRWGVSAASDEAAQAPWGTYGTMARLLRRGLWVVSKPSDDAASSPWGRYTTLRTQPLRAPSPASAPADSTRWVPWTRFSRTAHGGVVVVVPPGDPNEPLFVIPVKASYFMINQLYLRRMDNDTLLPATNINASLDVDSWTWTFSASLPASALSLVQRTDPEVPVILEAEINSHAVQFVLEEVSRDRTFKTATLSLSGRGVSAELSEPFSPRLAFGSDSDRTAQQLAAHVLTVNGVPLDWALDWQMADWLVPADTWTKQGTYMDALVEIATAAGGYVQPHPSARTLRFLKRYPVLPWDWASTPPDYELPSSVVTVEGIAWKSKPKYTRAFAAGMRNGVSVIATRAGTDGATEASPFAHPLITHVDAGRGATEAVLADTGEQADVRLRLPVFPDVGLILPGSLVRYVDGGITRHGLARAIQVEGSMAASWQTIEVETHA